MDKFLRKVIPASTYEKIRHAVLFRAEDPNNLHQILPPRFNPTTVKRIQGFRYPSPGSRVGARVPIVEHSDQIFDTNQYVRDPSNLPRKEEIHINTSKPINMLMDPPNVHSQNKRKINLLVYDKEGLRTTKTANWDALNTALKAIEPNHLPQPAWYKEMDEMYAECERKGLPYAPGRRFKAAMSDNYNKVRW